MSTLPSTTVRALASEPREALAAAERVVRRACSRRCCVPEESRPMEELEGEPSRTMPGGARARAGSRGSWFGG